MHSIDSFMKEKEKLYEIIKMSKADYMFPKIGELDSYYVSYSDSKHCDNSVIEYSSCDVIELRKNLNSIWNGTTKEKVIPVFIAGINKSKEESDNYLKQVDLHNYMM